MGENLLQQMFETGQAFSGTFTPYDLPFNPA
jgi:hypothetical protein